ncbi:MAG: minor capsid protein [Lachnospiraceae bacterium]|nr:minor capsid protein [Lachnospiraceae bacterium]
MIYLSDVRDWLKTLISAKFYYIGKLDSKNDESIGVYQRKNPAPPVTAIGQPSSYEIKPISILIHWNKNANETEKAAYELYEQLTAVFSLTLNNTHVQFIQLLQSEPVDVGTDDSGVYERVIEFNLYYERKI